ncbi:hypothetical protein ACFZC6_01970 [Streptomyces ossamyceticus]|uniref:hypothetical protein n=1 Tax=Streptomyces ossamyceticus TaxID=249581 RepID=UPI0036E7AEE8
MTPLTDTQHDEIEARLAAATPGPWGVYEFGGSTAIDIAAALEDTGTGYRARREICRLEDEPLDNDPTHREWTAEEDWAQVQADAEFIAHAPADVRALLDENRRLRTQRRTLTDSEYNAAWHAVEGAAGEEGADPGTVLHAVLDRLGIDLPPAPPVHGCPPDGSGLTPCCGRTPFELPRTDRMATDPALVTCQPAVSSG